MFFSNPNTPQLRSFNISQISFDCLLCVVLRTALLAENLKNSTDTSVVLFIPNKLFKHGKGYTGITKGSLHGPAS